MTLDMRDGKESQNKKSIVEGDAPANVATKDVVRDEFHASI